MDMLFVNACMRKESRTQQLAHRVLEEFAGSIEEIHIGTANVAPLDSESIVIYNDAVAAARYDHPMFDFAKQFASAEHILIAAPLWNFSIPSKLNDYLELVCTQGLSFDVDSKGVYHSLCAAKTLTFVTTSGGITQNPQDDHAFGLIRTLNDQFWHIPDLKLVSAAGLDIYGADVDALLTAAAKKACPLW